MNWRREQHREHVKEYEFRAQKLGINFLKAHVPASKEELVVAYETNPHLNNIPLELWDRQHPSILDRRRHTRIPEECWTDEDGKKYFSWAICDSVCVLKHVAKYHIIGVNEEDDFGWSEYERTNRVGDYKPTITEFLQSKKGKG